MLDVCRNTRFRVLTANNAFNVVDSVGCVFGYLGLGTVSNNTLDCVEGDVRRSNRAALTVKNNLDPVLLPDTHTGVGGA